MPIINSTVALFTKLCKFAMADELSLLCEIYNVESSAMLLKLLPM